jgi:predicted metal-binding protein
MLRAVEAGPSVVVCSTCRLSAEHREDDEGRRGGALLAAAMRALQARSTDLAVISVQEMPCLFACQRHCVVHIRAPGRIGYVLGDFTPDAASAGAVLEYARLHAESEEGVVRYADWPKGVKGHFITRTPPEGYVAS